MMTEQISILESAVSSITDAKEKVDAINRLAFEIRNSDTKRSILLCQEAQKISCEINYTEGNATALANEGFCYVQVTDYELALEKSFHALEIFEEQKNEKGIALTRYNLCLVYQRLGDYNLALDHITKSLNINQANNNLPEVARCILQLGYLYAMLHDYPSALDFYEQGIKLNRELENKAGEGAVLMGFGHVYLQMKEFEKSREYLLQSMALREQIKDWRGYAAAMNDYMTLCYETGKYDEAEKISLKGRKLAEELGDKMGISRFMIDCGKIYFKQNKTDEAEKILLEALQQAEQINLKIAIPSANFFLSEIYKAKGDFEKALKHHQHFHEVKLELLNTDAAMKAKSIQFTGKIENAQKEAEINRLKNVELKNAFDEIAEKNKDITDSINYAKRIQHALLASDDLLKKNLHEYFVFFRPKDIVSGDFYWAVEKNGRFYLAVCDSTGHGVPGAFMSLLNISFLNEAISEKNISPPNEVLNHVRKRLVESISADGAQDGMDGILICIDKNNLFYSAAHNAPVLVKNGALIELPADKMPIGLGDKKDSFKLETLNFEPGTILYLYTDGYADQFGGEKGKKFKYKQLNEKLLAISHLSLAEQKKELDKTFDKWKGNLEQVDDVLVIGIKI